MSKSVRIMIKNVRCQFPKLFQAEEYMGKKNFSIGLLIPADSENYKAVEAAADEAAESAFPGKGASMVKKFRGSRTTWPLKELDDGAFIITPKRREEQGAPLVMDQKKQILPADSGKPYAGCYVNASVDVFCYTKNGGGITAYLNGVQFVKDGQPLGAGATAASCKDDFEELETPDELTDGSDLL